MGNFGQAETRYIDGIPNYVFMSLMAAISCSIIPQKRYGLQYG